LYSFAAVKTLGALPPNPYHLLKKVDENFRAVPSTLLLLILTYLLTYPFT